MNPTPRHLIPQIKIAAEMWQEVRDWPYPVDRWLGNHFHQNRKRFGSRNRKFYSEVIYSLFRNRTFLECWAKELGSAEEVSTLVLLASLMEGLATLEDFASTFKSSLSGQMPDSFPERLRARELPKSVLCHNPIQELALRFSFPEWLVKRWQDRFGLEECRALLESFSERPPLTIRANPVKISRDKLLDRFCRQGHSASATERSPWGITFGERKNLFDTAEFREGLFEVQDEGSQIVCQTIDPRPGEVVWDVCAGGGGKSLLLGAIMKNQGRVIATDIRKTKLEEVRKRARRAGIFNIFPADLERLAESRELKRGADKILVDAPCSGTGTLRRNPDAKWKLREEKFEEFHRDQLAILEKAAGHLKPGGRLYYATCSLEPSENESVIEDFLKHRPGWRVVASPGPGDGFLRLLPHRDKTDGFFLAAVENKG